MAERHEIEESEANGTVDSDPVARGTDPSLRETNVARDLFYILDPMCSWCWAFRGSWRALMKDLSDRTRVHLVMGGLAPDCDEPMPEEMRQYLKKTWESIEQRTGARFNFEFWERNTPRRSTYPACRAVLAAARQKRSAKYQMVEAIQHAYYQEARNPSDRSTLVALAAKLGLDPEQFERDLDSEDIEHELMENLNFVRSLGIQGFPATVWRESATDGSTPRYGLLNAGYIAPEELLRRWHTVSPDGPRSAGL
jgi:putative protein-disulfide isomerase